MTGTPVLDYKVAQTCYLGTVAAATLSSLHLAMVIAVTVVRIMEVTIDQIIDMVAMRHCFMSAAGPMHMLCGMDGAFVPRRAILRIGRGYVDYMLIDVAFMLVMQMAVVQIVDVAIVHDPGVSALRAVHMIMIFVLRRITIAH